MDLSSVVSQFLTWSQSFGYVGIFFANFIGSASIFFPIPAFLIVFALGSILNPWFVALAAAIGSSLGELTGYLVGMGSERVIEKKHKKYKKWLEGGKQWFKNKKAFPFIILFAATPLPDDVVGILCGIFNYDLKKFLAASLIGKFVMNVALAWGGFFGIRWILTVFGGV